MEARVTTEGAGDEDAIRAWFANDGWQLEEDTLRSALRERGADEDLVFVLVDEAADRQRRAPFEPRPDDSQENGGPSRESRPAAAQHASPAVDRKVGGALVPASPANVVPLHAEQPHNIPPQNLEAEEAVLGAMMISPVAVDTVSELLAADGSEFYRESHARIYRAALALHTAGEPVDAIALTDRLEQTGELDQVGGRVRLHELAALVPASANVGHYARIVREMATLRGLIRAGGEIARLGWERPGEASGLVDEAGDIVYRLAAGDTLGGIKHGRAALLRTFERITDLYESGSEIIGTPTGFRDFDRLTSGLEPGNLIVIGARPSMGKSGFALTVASNIAVDHKTPVAIFSLEMSDAEISQRLLARYAHVDLLRIRTGRIKPDEWPRLSAAGDKLVAAPIYTRDTDISLLTIRTELRRLKTREPDLGLVVVDYLQLMTQDAENRTQEITKISRGLKTIARDLQVPILALSQLNRAVEGRVDKRPTLSDLRESGAIEQDADLVGFLYRDHYYNPDDADPAAAELIIAKHRNGPTGQIDLAFVKHEASFTDLARPGVF